MNLRAVVVLATCLSFCVAPASSTSLLAAAAAMKGAIVGAGLTALKSGGGSETVIIQSQPGSVAEVVPVDQITVQDLHKPMNLHNAQTITYTSSNPISRLWGAVSNAIAAKAKAIGDIFRPNRVVIIVPQTTEKTTTTTKPTPVITVDFEHKPSPSINIELDNKPLQLPTFEFELNQKPLQMPTIDVEVNHKPLQYPAIGVELNHKPIQYPTVDVELNHKPLSLPSLGVSASASYGRDYMFRRLQPVAVLNYVNK